MDPDHVLRIAREIIGKLTYCMAITVTEEGQANARVIQMGKLTEDWTVSFITERRCRKFREIERTGRLTLAYQHDPDRAYVTLLGTTEIVGDAAAKRAVWKPESSRFHPGGPEDPDVVLIRFTTERIEMYSGVHDIAPPPRGLSAAVLTREGNAWHCSAT